MKQITVQIEGTGYVLSALDARQSVAFLEASKAHLPDPIEQLMDAANKLPEGKIRDSFVEKNLDDAFARSKKRGTQSDPDLEQFTTSVDGMKFLFTAMLQKKQPHLSPDECYRLMLAYCDEQGAEAVAQIETLNKSATRNQLSEEQVESAFFRKSRPDSAIAD